MMVSSTIAGTLATLATIAVADDQGDARRFQDLLDRGFRVVAEGQFFETFQCDPQLAGITAEEIRRGYACPSGKPIYGTFKRLKGDNSEFVCVSFRDWACYKSTN
jgi:hypothetical protein